jgi:hydroxyacylglutathione hydrolase
MLFKRIESEGIAHNSYLIGLPAPLTPIEFKREMEKGAVVIDASEPAAFGGAHIRGAYSIWLEGIPAFASQVLPHDRPLLLVSEDECHIDKAVRYLIRGGFDRIAGYLKGGIESWYNADFPVENLPLLSVHQLKNKIEQGEELIVIDVRGQDEWDSGHIKVAIHIYVGHLTQRLAEVPRDKPVAVICRVGHRSGLGASILLRAGYRNVYNVLGGMKAWVAAGFPVTND